MTALSHRGTFPAFREGKITGLAFKQKWPLPHCLNLAMTTVRKDYFSATLARG